MVSLPAGARPMAERNIAMAWLMAGEAFRSQQHADRYAAHIRPVNELVDDLRDDGGRGWMPYVAPWHGGTEARKLGCCRCCATLARDQTDELTMSQHCVACGCSDRRSAGATCRA
jgi:hypothetical protein